MKNLQKKEKNLNQLIEKLNNLNVSYSQFGFDNKSLEKENNLIKLEKEKLIRKDYFLIFSKNIRSKK